MKFLAFAASHRPESYNRKLIAIAATHLNSKGMNVDVADYADFDMPVFNDTLADKASLPEYAFRFAKRTKNTNGIIISSPEYNWSYPGSLKNIIDWSSCITTSLLASKTILLTSASPSSRGGILGLHHLKSPFESIQATVFPKVVPLGSCTTAFDAAGKLMDGKQQQLFSTILDEYVTFTEKLSNT